MRCEQQCSASHNWRVKVSRAQFHKPYLCQRSSSYLLERAKLAPTHAPAPSFVGTFTSSACCRPSSLECVRLQKKNRNYGDHTNRIGQRPRMQRITTRIYIHNSYLYDFAIPLCDLCRRVGLQFSINFTMSKLIGEICCVSLGRWCARDLCAWTTKNVFDRIETIINSMNFGWKKRMRSAWADIHLRYSLLHFQWFFCCIFRLYIDVIVVVDIAGILVYVTVEQCTTNELSVYIYPSILFVSH